MFLFFPLGLRADIENTFVHDELSKEMENLTPYESAIKFEKKVLNVIRGVLSDDEVIQSQHEYVESIHQLFEVDIFLPNGCEAFNWQKTTFIEAKQNLNSMYVYRRLLEFERYANYKDFKTYQVIIIYESYDTSNFQYLRHDNSVKLLSLAQLIASSKGKKRNKASKHKEEIKKLELVQNAVRYSKYSLFLGAGVSISAKLPNWDELLKSLLCSKDKTPYKYISDFHYDDIKRSCGSSSIIIGRYALDGYTKKNKNFIDRLHAALYNKYQPSPLIDSICGLVTQHFPEQIITYNYDNLIELGLHGHGKGNFIPVFDKVHLGKGQVPIYHVHGIISKDRRLIQTPILSETDYHNLYNNPCSWPNVVQLQALNSTTCIFIGFSMTDPNQRRLLEFARNEQEKLVDFAVLPHFVFLKKEVLNRYVCTKINEEHWKEQELMLNNLGLNVIWYNTFDELPVLIEQITNCI